MTYAVTWSVAAFLELGSERLWYANILGIWYSVDDNAMTVTILSVGPARRH